MYNVPIGELAARRAGSWQQATAGLVRNLTMGKKHKAHTDRAALNAEIRALESTIEDCYGRYVLAGADPIISRPGAMIWALGEYARDRAGWDMFDALPKLQLPGAGLALLVSIYGDKKLRAARALLDRWQADPDHVGDVRQFLATIIPPGGIHLTNEDGTVNHITRGAFIRGEI